MLQSNAATPDERTLFKMKVQWSGMTPASTQHSYRTSVFLDRIQKIQSAGQWLSNVRARRFSRDGAVGGWHGEGGPWQAVELETTFMRLM